MGSTASSAKDVEKQPLLEKPQAKVLYYASGLLTLFFIALGVLFLHFTEGWDLLVSTYVLTQIITTIGYGDYTPSSSVTKIFMCFYAITVLVVVSFFVNSRMKRALTTTSDMVVAHLTRMDAYLGGNVQKSKAEQRFEWWNKLFTSLMFFLVPVAIGAIGTQAMDGCTCENDNASPNCVDGTFDECIRTGGYIPTWLDSFYMSVITLSTIGFGDFYPRSNTSRFFATIWMLIGVTCTAMFIDTLSHLFFEDEVYQRLAMADELEHMDYATFQQVDADGNGYLTRGEFLSYSLIKYADVSPALVQKVLETFDMMEKDGDGQVTWDEIRCHQAQKSAASRVARSRTPSQ